MSLTTLSSASPAAWMPSAYRRCWSSRAVSSSRPVSPMTPLIGVRISWLIVATNSDFSRDASSASSRAAASAASVSRRSVMSRAAA